MSHDKSKSIRDGDPGGGHGGVRDGDPGGGHGGFREGDPGGGHGRHAWLFAGSTALRPLYEQALTGWSSSVPPDMLWGPNKMPVEASNGHRFPADGWDPLLKAGAIAGRFAAIDGAIAATDPKAPPDQITADSSPADVKTADSNLIADLQALHAYQKSRKNYDIAEIRAQADNFVPYFCQLTGASEEVRPATFLLIMIGIQIGGLLSAHWKLNYMRARPHQTWPALAPCIPTPRHPSYPSGHALQSFLIAELIARAAPHLEVAARSLASRIARNREVAGLHYPSDTAASAGMIEKIMMQMDKLGSDYSDLLEAAKREYGPAKSPLLPHTIGPIAAKHTKPPRRPE